MFVPYLPKGIYQSPDSEIRIQNEGLTPFLYPHIDIDFRLNRRKPRLRNHIKYAFLWETPYRTMNSN
jgi:hypothetical protein